MNPTTIEFISKLLFNTLRLDFHYFQKPYHDFSSFDKYLRDSLINSAMLYNEVLDLVSAMVKNKFHFISDNFLLNYIIFYPYENKNDIITIGPYFNSPIDNEYWKHITELNQLAYTDIENLKGFIYNIPVIDLSQHLVSIANSIVNYINPGSDPFAVQNHDLSHNNDENFRYSPKEDFQVYANMVEKRYAVENKLLHYITEGNWEKALQEGEKFINAPFEPRLNNYLREHKSLLVTANTLFRKAVETTYIHPVHLHEITSKFVNLIEASNTEKDLNKLYEKMVKDYCVLVRNKSMKNYSPTIRKILYYIEFNIHLPLTLAEIAEKLNLSVPYLASIFKKELNTTIISYVNQQRIEIACKLLKTSSLSIQDVGASVGINDRNYFTKVFKKEKGITPTEYRKQKDSNPSQS